jgi:hypothetical protein
MHRPYDTEGFDTADLTQAQALVAELKLAIGKPARSSASLACFWYVARRPYNPLESLSAYRRQGIRRVR